jgi:NACHT domain
MGWQVMRRAGNWRRVPVSRSIAGICVLIAVVVLAFWAARPGWLLTVGRWIARSFRWIDKHWVNPLAITAWATTLLFVAAVVVPLLMRRLDRHDDMRATGGDARQRQAMLRRVRYNWITGVLEPSLEHAAQLTLRLECRPDVLQLGSRRPGRIPASFADGTSIINVFDQVSGGLLILGAPGSGKTTLLLQLANGLLERAEADLAQPIPVVVNLASWAVQRESLASWLVGEVAVSYKVPRRLVSTWVSQDDLVLLLDGLDEVAERHRSTCVEAINDYRRDHGMVPMVVCTRTQEVGNLTVRPALDEAVELMPPTDVQIDTYLGHLEAAGTPLDDVPTMLGTDQDLLRSPLMLRVITLAYHGRPATALQLPGSAEQQRAQLWQAYVTRMFEQRPLDPNCGYTAEQAIRWLRWLARALRDHNQTELHLDRLTAVWTPAPQGKRLEVAGSWLVRATASDIQPAEELRWSWERVISRLRLGAALGLPLATALGVVIWLLLWRADRAAGGVSGRSADSVLISLAALLALLLAVLLLYGPVLALGSGVTTQLRDERASPNQGIRRSAWNGLIGGLATMLIVGPMVRLPSRLIAFLPGAAGAPVTGVGPEVFFGLIVGLLAGLYYGGAACLQYWAVRAWLVYTGAAPCVTSRFWRPWPSGCWFDAPAAATFSCMGCCATISRIAQSTVRFQPMPQPSS